MSTSRGILATAVLVVGLGLTGCGSDEPTDEPQSTSSSSATGSSSSAAGSSSSPADSPVIDVTFAGDTVTPNGDRVKVKRGQDITLNVTADAPGEIHVHSTPEQELEYDAGTSTLTIVGIDQPGIVDVESHNLEQIIVQLEVS